jgi:hypothetical protein
LIIYASGGDRLLTINPSITFRVDANAPTTANPRQFKFLSGKYYILTLVCYSTTSVYINVAEYKTF